VKLSLLALLFVIALSTPSAQAQSPRPIPPGIHSADRADSQAQQSIPPPSAPRSVIDPVRLRQDADELALLAQSIPPDVDRINRGLLPKDLVDKLKRIEKLSKRLRGELAH